MLFAVAALVPVVAWSLNVSVSVSTGAGLALRRDVPPGNGTLRREEGAEGRDAAFSPELRGRARGELPGERYSTRSPPAAPDWTATPRCAPLAGQPATYPREDPLGYPDMVAGRRHGCGYAGAGATRRRRMRLWHPCW